MRLTYFLKEGKGIGLINKASYILLLTNFYTFGYLAGLDSFGQKIAIFESKNTSKTIGLPESVEDDKNSNYTLVASKSGTRVYFVWCSGVSRIKAENKVFFANLDEALKKGYKPASNCPGM